MESDNYGFTVSSDLLDDADNFEAWLDKNGVEFIITDEYLPDETLQPLLHQQVAALNHETSHDCDLESLSQLSAINTKGALLFEGGSEYDAGNSNDGPAVIITPLPHTERRKENVKSKSELVEEFARKGQLFVEFTIHAERGVEITIYPTRERADPLSHSALFANTAILPTHSLIPIETASSAVSAFNLHQRHNGGTVVVNEPSDENILTRGRMPVTSFAAIPLTPALPALRMPSIRLQSGVRLFLCARNECQAIFIRQPAARMHVLMEIGHKEYRCDREGCKWAFYSKLKLKRHQETHLNRKNFECTFPKCAKRFTTIYNLNIHRRIHERVAHLSCPVLDCDEKFQTVRMREKHIKASHRSSEAPFKCPHHECSRTFFLTAGLTAHARTHAVDESELRCSYPDCGRLFKHPSRLKEHSRRHTGSRPYHCTFSGCTWSFSTASKLKRHQSTHTNDRKFHCTIGTCTKSFLRSEHLREHTLTHIGQRSFQCSVCPASFFGKSSLVLHARKSHPDEKQACARLVPYATDEDTLLGGGLCKVEQVGDIPSDDPTDALTVAIAAAEDSCRKAANSGDKSPTDHLLEQAIQSLGVPSDMILGTGLLPEEPLDLLQSEHFSTVNLRDLE